MIALIKRREFITLLGSAAAWPLAARAQQPDRVRRIGVLINTVDNDPDAVARLSAFKKALRELGWDEGRNLQIDTRLGVEDDRIRRNAAELIALAPDVILANGPPPAMALQQATRSVPIVFVGVTDPVGMGIVQSLARPGGNATGFISAEFGQRRHDRDPNCGDNRPPRRDHQGGVTKSVANRLSAAGLRHCGRPDILRP